MSEAPIPIVNVQELDGGTDESTTINASLEGNLPTNCTTAQPDCSPSNSKGWLMVSLVFIANFLVFGFFKSLGMLTKILNKEFDATMNVYILMCITYSLNCAAGPLSCYLTRRYSARTMALVGTSMVTFGLILSWFAQSLTFLYFSMGIFTGIGSGLTYPTGVILVSSYFTGTKNAAIANALVVSGSPIGGMIMPFVISFLSELYTSRGAFLIIGGLMFHAILCARAFRQPTDANRSNPRVMRDSDGDIANSTSKQSHDPDSTEKEEDLKTYDEENNLTNPKVHSCSTGILTVSGQLDRRCRDCGTTASVQTVRKFQTCHSVHSPSLSLQESHINEADDGAQGLTYRRRGATNILTRNNTLLEVQGIVNSANRISQNTEAVTATGSQPYILALDHSCIILCPSNTDIILKQKNPQFAESTKSVTVGGGASDIENINGNENAMIAQQSNTTRKSAIKTCKFISPLGNPIYVFLLLSNTATAISTANIYLMVSQLVVESDNDYTKTSLIYLLISSADLTGRITGAFLCDKKFTSPSVIYAIGLVSAGINSSLLATYTSFLYLCMGVFAYGFSSGFHIGIYGLLLTNIVGIDKIHAGYGISMFVNGTIQCAAILLSGSMIAMYSSCFVWLAPVFGGILAGGGVLWICGSLLFMKNAQNSSNEEYDRVQEDDIVNNNVNPDIDT